MLDVFEDDDDRRAFLNEEFDTGHPTLMLGAFENAFQESPVGDHVIEARVPEVQCRSSDVAARGLIKGAMIRRLKDGKDYRIMRLEPDGFGMTTLVLAE